MYVIALSSKISAILFVNTDKPSQRKDSIPEFLTITSFVIGFTRPMRSLNALNSIHNNQNIAYDNGAYSLITKIRSYYIASTVV